MRLFSRTSSPVSLEPIPPCGKATTFDPPSSPCHSRPSQTTSSSDNDITPPPSTNTCTDAPSGAPPSPTTLTAVPPAAQTPRRPRLYHGAPPFYQCWASVRQAQARRAALRFCTVSGPMLRLSATPAADVLATSVCVYGAVVTTDDFPSMRITVRTSDVRLTLSAETREDHTALAQQLLSAARRTIISDYAFVNHVRDSFFSRVCDAADARGHPVTVKLSTKAELSPRLAELARREPVLLLAVPSHPAIPQLQDVYDSPRAYYVVTAGQALPTLSAVYAQRGPFCEGDVAVVLADLLSALQHMREARVAHRFISPATVVVSADACRVRSACVVDFEMAALVDDDKQDIAVPDVLEFLRHETGMRKLHAAYVPPEVYANTVDNVDDAFAQDVWAVGMVMHWMLVGCTPFDGHVSDFDDVQRLVADARGMPVFSGPLWRGVTSGAKHLCASLLHADVRARLSPSRALQHPWLRL